MKRNDKKPKLLVFVTSVENLRYFAGYADGIVTLRTRLRGRDRDPEDQATRTGS